MASRDILEDIALVENNFSTDSRDKDGARVVSYESRRSIKVYLAIEQIVEIEVVKDAKGEDRAIVTLMNDHRYVTRRSARELCEAIDEAAGNA